MAIKESLKFQNIKQKIEKERPERLRIVAKGFKEIRNKSEFGGKIKKAGVLRCQNPNLQRVFLK